jgi:hypothetical protein
VAGEVFPQAAASGRFWRVGGVIGQQVIEIQRKLRHLTGVLYVANKTAKERAGTRGPLALSLR